jgi:hypothetical protein
VGAVRGGFTRATISSRTAPSLPSPAGTRERVQRHSVASPKMTLSELYEREIRSRPAGERLRLAARILNDIAPDESDSWSEQDLREFSRMGWARAEQKYGEKNEL